MPNGHVVGIIDPSHKERKYDRSGSKPRWFPPEELLSIAREADPRWSPWTYELLAAAIGELQDRGDHISTTALVAPCPRSVVLERREDHVIDMDRLWRSFRGTMVHYVLEDTARSTGVAEHRFHAQFAGGPLSCSPDLVTPDTIYDYKNVPTNPLYDYPKPYHSEQLQLNRYIVNHAEKVTRDGKVVTSFPFDYRSAEFKHLVIVYMDINGPKALETLHTVKQEGRQRGRREPYIWDDKLVESHFKDRYQSLQAALESYPEWPDGIEDLDWWGPNYDPENPWACPGWPFCSLRHTCLASRYPHGLVW